MFPICWLFYNYLKDFKVLFIWFANHLLLQFPFLLRGLFLASRFIKMNHNDIPFRFWLRVLFLTFPFITVRTLKWHLQLWPWVVGMCFNPTLICISKFSFYSILWRKSPIHWFDLFYEERKEMKKSNFAQVELRW